MSKQSKKNDLRQALAAFDEYCESRGYHLSQQADPSVERLLEGFCYVTRQLEDFVSQRSPDFVWHLLNIIWPESLQDIPAMAVAQIVPVSYSVFLPEKTLLRVGMAESECLRFSTMIDYTVLPAIIESAVFDKNVISLKVVFQGHCGLADLEKMLLYIDPQADELYQLSYLFRQQLISMRLQCGDQQLVLPVECFPVSLVMDHEDPFLLINRFFQCPALFLFFEINFPVGCFSKEGWDFMLHFEFQEHFKLQPHAITLFHINCVPVINAFSQAGEPLSVSHERDCYEICADHQQHDVNIIEVSQISAKTLTGDAVKLCNPYVDPSLPGGVSYVLHKLKHGLNIMVDVNQLQKPIILSMQLWVHQAALCRQFYWKNAKLTADTGHLKGRLIGKPSLPVQSENRDGSAIMAVFHRKITPQTTLAELQFLVNTLLCQHSARSVRMIAGVMRFSAQAIFQVHRGVIREVIVWDIQLNQDHFDTRSRLYHFAAMLERLIVLYRPVNKIYQVNVVEFPDDLW